MSRLTFQDYLTEVKKISSSDLERSEKIAQVIPYKEKLLQNEDLLVELLSKAASMEEPEAFLPPDINGFSLYRDPDKDFSVHVFVWAPRVPYPIHDHGSWGIVGVYRGQIEETKWHWLGQEDNLVCFEPQRPHRYLQGQAFFVLPLDEGPHSMKVLGQKPAITIHTYGKPVRNSLLRLFHPSLTEKGKYSYYHAYPLYVYRRMLALDALDAVNSEAAADLADEIIRDSKNKVLIAALKNREER